jgi:hypothetical protein
VATTASKPSRSASGRIMSSGVVVASTSGRPASRWSSMMARANGCTASASTSAACLPASRTCSWRQPLAKRAAWRVRIIDGRVSPTRLNRL